jgi:predicted secreted protein
MRVTSIIAIYTLFWSLSFFLVLPFRLQPKAQAEDVEIRGQMPGAPAKFSFGRTAFWTTIVAIVLFGLYYVNYVEGWLPVDEIDFLSRRVYGN